MDGVTEKSQGHETIYLLLFLSGFLGFALGLLHATWQVSAETGQVLAGIVTYPPDNPNYMYHIKVFSLINQLSALLLLVTDSEIVVSHIISGLLGMVSFQALAMLIFAINRDVRVAILGVALVYFGGYRGHGASYPIWLLGEIHTYGILGLSYIVLVVASLGAGANRLGLFLLGLAPSVHPSLGSWLYLLLFIASLLQRHFAKSIVTNYTKYFLAGFFIALASFLIQWMWMQDLPSVDPGIKKIFLDRFVQYWDFHRRKFFWDYTTQQLRFLKPGVLLCVYSVILAYLGSRYFRARPSVSFLFKVVIVSGLFSLFSAALTHLPPEDLPQALSISMPVRLINFNNFIQTAMLFAVMTAAPHRSLRLNFCVFVFLLLTCFFSFPSGIWIAGYAAALFWFAFLAFQPAAPQLPSRSPFQGMEERLKKYFPRLLGQASSAYGKVFLVFMLLFFLFNMNNPVFISRYLTHRSDFRDRTNDPFYRKVAERKGFLLTTADFPLVSLRTRRPVLIDPSGLDGFNMVPESGEILNRLLKDVYGVSLLVPPPKDYQNPGLLPPGLHKTLWESRTVQEWQELGRTYGIAGILTKSDWKLSLPVVVEDDTKILYEIPGLSFRDPERQRPIPDRLSQKERVHCASK